MVIKAYIYHKRAEKYSDCQDCFGINSQNNRIAVSDGMSQSIFPQWWAKILVDYYLDNGQFPQDIRPLQKEWQDMLREEIKRREKEAIANPARDPWRLQNYLAEKSGAGATLCGLSFEGSKWTCECLGDTCVITINRQFVLRFYTSQEGEFNNQPDYFDSFREGRGTPLNKIIADDVLAILMVSDPFAQLFQSKENDRNFIEARFEELKNLTDHESFVKLVEKWRDEFGMHNDDSTLVLIENLSTSGFDIRHRDDLEELCSNEKEITTFPETAHSSKLEPETLDVALSQFRLALETLLKFYPRKKKYRKIKKLISSIIKHKHKSKQFLSK